MGKFYKKEAILREKLRFATKKTNIFRLNYLKTCGILKKAGFKWFFNEFAIFFAIKIVL